MVPALDCEEQLLCLCLRRLAEAVSDLSGVSIGLLPCDVAVPGIGTPEVVVAVSPCASTMVVASAGLACAACWRVFALVLVDCLTLLDLEDRKGDDEVETAGADADADADADGTEASVVATGWGRAELLALVATIGQSVENSCEGIGREG